MKIKEATESGNTNPDHQNEKKNKKKKRSKHEEEEEEIEIETQEEENENTTNKKGKKSKKKKPKQMEEVPTVSIAVAGSIIDNAQSLELATRLAGQIARAATIFRIDEVVVFDSEAQTEDQDSVVTTTGDSNGSESGACFLVRILQYLETPQYLRRRLFPMHHSLKFVGLLPPLDAPHHVRKHEWSPYREGITLKDITSNTKGTLVDVGLSKNIMVEQVLETGQRVTVAMGTDRNTGTESLKQVVTSMSPREKMGLYWGYSVRYASKLCSVFKGSPYKDGYDHIIGTSEHGTAVTSSELTIPKFRHLLIVFGGLAGLEESIEEDKSLKGKDAHEVFNWYLNICPNQGSRTIRTEVQAISYLNRKMVVSLVNKLCHQRDFISYLGGHFNMFTILPRTNKASSTIIWRKIISGGFSFCTLTTEGLLMRTTLKVVVQNGTFSSSYKGVAKKKIMVKVATQLSCAHSTLYYLLFLM